MVNRLIIIHYDYFVSKPNKSKQNYYIFKIL